MALAPKADHFRNNSHPAVPGLAGDCMCHWSAITVRNDWQAGEDPLKVSVARSAFGMVSG